MSFIKVFLKFVWRIANLPLVLLRLIGSRDYRFIWKSRVFDESYFRQYLGERGKYQDALRLYLKTSIPEYEKKGVEWLLQQEIIDPNPLFDTSFYLGNYFPQGFTGKPFVHYLKKGWKDGLWPSPFFDPDIYSKRSGWLPEDGNPLSHYCRNNKEKGISPGSNFDMEWYLDQSETLKSVKNSLVTHYRQKGISEGKSPVPVFSPEYYRNYLEKNKQTTQDPFTHYIVTSASSDNRPNEWFDPGYYCQVCDKDVKRSKTLDHYLTEGVFQKRYINSCIEKIEKKPVISIIVPVFNPNPHFLNNCIRSVLYQTYPHWELCLADDCSTDEDTVSILKKWEQRDERIKVFLLQQNTGISNATNKAASLGTGDYFGFLDNDDELSLDCLFNVVTAINETKAEVLYTDEDLIGADGRRFSIFHKSDYNPELLLSHNYITHFTCVARKIFDSTGGLNADFDGAQDYDFILKATELANRVVHLKKVLYHWRASDSSTSINHDQKTYAHDAGKRALQNALNRRSIKASVKSDEYNFFYRLEFPVGNADKISVIIWLDDLSEKNLQRVGRIRERTSYENCLFIVVYRDNDSCAGLINDILHDDDLTGIETYPVPEEIEKTAALNQAAFSASCDFLVFFDQSIVDINADWQEQMIGPFGLAETGVVCGRLLFDGEDGISYTVPDISIKSAVYFHDYMTSCSRHLNGMHCFQRVDCCSSELTMVRFDLFARLGGFNAERFNSIFSMADFSLRAKETGARIIYTPHAAAEIDKSRWSLRNGDEENALLTEMELFKKKWKNRNTPGGEFYNNEIIRDRNIEYDQFKMWLFGPT